MLYTPQIAIVCLQDCLKTIFPAFKIVQFEVVRVKWFQYFAYTLEWKSDLAHFCLLLYVFFIHILFLLPANSRLEFTSYKWILFKIITGILQC